MDMVIIMMAECCFWNMSVLYPGTALFPCNLSQRDSCTVVLNTARIRWSCNTLVIFASMSIHRRFSENNFCVKYILRINSHLPTVAQQSYLQMQPCVVCPKRLFSSLRADDASKALPVPALCGNTASLADTYDQKVWNITPVVHIASPRVRENEYRNKCVVSMIALALMW